jgi:glycosidase
MIYPGAPTIYYGDEVGVTGGDDPRNRCTYPWEEDGGKADKSMLAEFKKLTALRNKNKILRRGSIEVVHVDDSVVVMLRKLGEEYAVAAVNNSLDAKSISVDLSKYEMPNKMTNPLDEEDTIRINSNKLQLTIEGVSGKLYLGKE